MFVAILFPKQSSFNWPRTVTDAAISLFRKLHDLMMMKADPDDVMRLDKQMLRDIGLDPDDTVAIAGPDALKAIAQRPFV